MHLFGELPTISLKIRWDVMEKRQLGVAECDCRPPEVSLEIDDIVQLGRAALTE